MASSDHAIARTNSRTVPISLRMRMGMRTRGSEWRIVSSSRPISLFAARHSPYMVSVIAANPRCPMIELKQLGRIALMTVTHGKANALDIALCREIVRRFGEVGDSAVILTGEGGIFSAGVDLVQATAGGAGYLRAFLPVLSQAFAAVFFHPAPVVAAINGHAVAGGCVLACAADRRLMAANAGRIGVTELLVGVPFPTVAFEIMRSAVAPHRFAEIMYGGATYLPPEARAIGLGDEIAEAGGVERAVVAAARLAELSPPVLAITKRQMRQAARERVRDSARIDAEIVDIWCAPETF